MNLKIIHLTFFLTVIEKIEISDHPGSALRGIFGQKLREIACLKGKENCKDCGFEDQCCYKYLFEPIMNEKELNTLSKGFYTKPRPYIIEVKNNRQTEFLPGDQLVINLSFFGEIKKHLPYIILAWKQAGMEGLGAKKGRFILSEIWNSDLIGGRAERVYWEYSGMVLDPCLCMEFKNVQEIAREMPADRVRIKFLTPMYLVSDGKFIKEIEFHLLLKNLFRRLSSLFFFYGDKPLELDFTELLNKAKEVKLTKDKLYLERWFRYSTRQNKKVEMKGLVGEVFYQGDIKPFLPYLIFGQYCYIGKNTVFGLGNYKIIP